MIINQNIMNIHLGQNKNLKNNENMKLLESRAMGNDV